IQGTVQHRTHGQHSFLDILLEQRVVVRVAGSARGLKAVDVVAPPRTRSPPERAQPNIAVVLEVVEHAGDGLLAVGVGAASKLTEEAHLAIVLEPLGRGGDTLDTDGVGNTRRGSTG